MAASVGTVIFSSKSGRGYIKDTLAIDTAGGFDNWDDGAGGASATSLTYWIAPEDMWLSDYIQVAATTATRREIVINGNPTSNIMRCSLHIPAAAMINRPRPGVYIPAGSKVALRTLA